MRVLAITPYYEPEGGGLERYAQAILQRLARRGHDVHCLAFTRSGLPDSDHDGVAVERSAAPMHLGNSPIDPAFAGRLRRKMEELAPDVVLAHTPVPFPAEMGFLAARSQDVPFVLTYHAGRLRGSTAALDGLATLARATLERRMISGSDRLIAVTPFVRDHALTRRREEVAIVPPGVDLERFRPKAMPEAPEVLFVGPLDSSYRWKGVDVLWEAFQKVRQQVPEARLRLVGHGDRFEEFHRRAAQDDRIRLSGRLGPQALVEAYQDASVLTLPSTTDAESFGMVLAEANACARPVVASRIGGIPDFVRHGDNGLLAEPGNADDLARRLIQVLQDPEAARHLGRRGRRRVLQEHDWDDLAMATEDVLRQAAERREPVAVLRG